MRPGRREVWIGGLLTLATLAVFARAVGCDFINWDDPDYVTANPYVRAGLTRAGFFWAMTTGHASNWHPLTWLSHMLDCQLWGLSPGAHHAVNVLFHAANTFVLFVFLRLATGALWRSAAVGAFFALHPLHVQSVAWVSERKDVLSTFLWLLALLAYWRYARKPGLGRYLVVFVLLALGLMAKPMLVTAPLVMLLLDVWPLGRLAATREAQPSAATDPHVERRRARTRRRGRGRRAPARPAERPRAVSVGWLVAEKVPLLALALVSALVTYVVQLRGGAMAAYDTVPVGARIANAVVAYVAYLRKTILPVGLVVFYPRVPLSTWQIAGSASALLAVSLAVLWLAPRRPWMLVGWLWYLVTLAPVIGLVQVGDQAIADRFTYISLVGPFIAVAWGTGEVVRRWPRLRMPVALSTALLLAGCAAASWRELGNWRDSISLFGHAVAVIPDNYIAQIQLGNALVAEGDLDEAMGHFAAAVRAKPDFAKAYNNLGVLLAKSGRIDEAMERYAEALRLDPDFPDAHSNLGVALAARGQIDEAIAHYTAALRAKPDYAAARENLARALALRGNR